METVAAADKKEEGGDNNIASWHVFLFVSIQFLPFEGSSQLSLTD